MAPSSVCSQHQTAPDSEAASNSFCITELITVASTQGVRIESDHCGCSWHRIKPIFLPAQTETTVCSSFPADSSTHQRSRRAARRRRSK
ncbi:hypothetical protein PAMP_001113 [Pampus punctatissimus]